MYWSYTLEQKYDYEGHKRLYRLKQKLPCLGGHPCSYQPHFLAVLYVMEVSVDSMNNFQSLDGIRELQSPRAALCTLMSHSGPEIVFRSPPFSSGVSFTVHFAGGPLATD